MPVNISESVGVTVEALSILGLKIAKDKDILSEVLKNDYNQLANRQNRPGESFVHLPLESDYQLRTMLDVIDSEKYHGRKYPKFSVWHKTHWTHGAKDISHLLKVKDRHEKNKISLSDLSGQSRLALSDGENFMYPPGSFCE